MAAYAAHLTRTNGGPPSVFQLAAQEALATTVKPALRKLVQYLSTVYPDRCSWLERWYDEVYLLMDVCLQYYYLKHYAASFSESLYGLWRVPVSASEWGSQRLPPSVERACVAVLALSPYLKDKVDAVVERWREDHEDGRLGKSHRDRLRLAAIRVHSTVHLIHGLCRLYQLGRYMSGSARSHSLSLAAMGLVLQDAPPHTEPENTWGDVVRGVLRGDLGSAMISFPLVGGLVLRGAEWAAFGVQCLRWWDSSGPRANASLPAPQPPKRDERAARFGNKCPLCLRSWKIPTALPVSGLVFCYVCISRHVRANHTCPVTNCPVTEQQLIRMYVD